MIHNEPNSNLSFLKATGEASASIVQLDWSKTSLGPIQTWPQSLKTTLSIVLTCPFPMFLFWGVDHICFYNDAYLPSLGRDHPGVLARKAGQVWPQVVPLLDKIVSGGHVGPQHTRLLPICHGEQLDSGQASDSFQVNYWTTSCSPVSGEQGQINGVLVLCEDTSGQTKARKAAEQSQLELLALFEESPVAIATIDRKDLVFTSANSFYGQLVGRLPGQNIGKPLLEALPELEGQGFDHLLNRVIETGIPFTASEVAVMLLRKGTIETIYVDFTYQPRRSGDGQVTGILVIATDVTGQVLSRKRIEESQSKLSTLIEQAPFAMAMYTGPELTIDTVNDAMLTLWGKVRSVVGQTFAQALPELEDQPFDQLLKDVFATGVEYHASEQHADLMIDGELKRSWFNFTYRALRDEKGRIYGLIHSAVDVSEQYLARQKLAQSEAKLRAVIEQAPSSVAIGIFLSRQLIIDMPNQAFIETIGRGAGIVGKRLADVMPELESQPFLHLLDHVYTSGQAYQSLGSPLQVLRNGQLITRYFNVSFTPLFDHKGQVYAILDISFDVTEQILDRQKLEQSQSRFRSLIEAAPIAIGLFVGRELVIENPNREFIEIVGKGDQIAGKRLVEVMPELVEHGQPYLKILDDVFTSGKMYKSLGDPVNIVRNGVMHHGFYNIYYVPLFDNDGKVYAIMDIATEVTGQVQAQKALEGSQAHLKLLQNAVPAMIFYLDTDQRYQSYNGVFCEWFHVGPTEAIGKTVAEFLGPVAYASVGPHLARAYSGERVAYQMYSPSRMGIDRWLSIVYTPHKDPSGQVLGLIVHASNVTDLMISQRTLEQKEAALLNAINLAELGTWRIDLTHIQELTGSDEWENWPVLENSPITYSSLMANWFGLPSGVPLGQLLALIDGQDLSKMRQALASSLADNSKKVIDIEFVIIHPLTRRGRIFHMQGSVLRNQDGKPLAIEGAARNITIERELQQALGAQVQLRSEELAAAVEELAASNEELRSTNDELNVSNSSLFRSNEELAQYASVASHDLQEPLRKIQIFSDMLSRSNRLEASERVLLEKIIQSSARMTMLIKDLLEFSRLSKVSAIREPVDLQAIVQSIQIDFELVIEEKKAVIRIGSLPVINAVRLQMNQLFYNLISNALKFTDPTRSPVIAIDCHKISDENIGNLMDNPLESTVYYRITVSDNGIGFEQEYSRQIFEVFKRLHDRDTFAGSGIGLAICERIVANHGGVLFAESQIGEGTCFTLILPESIV